ncbi:MAG: cytochrome c maturation protein CcmE [Bacillota bacterium]|nr:cytochrome c maturation protein CcmE [Bacillota bacterium]
MKAKTKILIAAAIIVVTISGLMVMGISNFSGRMVTIEAVLASDGKLDEKFLRIEGDLVPDSTEWNAAAVELTFQITDGERILDVYHNGFQPDNFYEGVEVILEGYYKGDGLFVAETVQTRCPSTYEEDVRTQE